MKQVIRLQRLYDDSARGWRLCLPRPLPTSVFLAVADRFASVMPLSLQNKRLHLYAIANSGTSLAVAIMTARGIQRNAGDKSFEQDLLTILKPGRYEHIATDIDQNTIPIIVDNSIKSGKTVSEVVQLMHDFRYPVNQVVTLVDYDDRAFENQKSELRESLGISVHPLFGLDEVRITNSSVEPETR